MFVISAKITKKKIVAISVIFAALVIFVSALIISSVKSADSADTKPSLTGKSNSDRVQYIKSFGWEIDDEPINIIEMVVPKEFDEEYKAYNELQKEVGLDLEKYKNKRVKRYRYNITNYPGGKLDINACVIVYNDKIIGGDVCLDRVDGFIHSLEMPISG